MKNKKLLKIIIIAVAIILLVTACAIPLSLNVDKLYVWWQNTGLGRGNAELELFECKTSFVSLSEIQDDNKFTLDQSMMLINTEYLLPDNFVPQISEYKDSTVYMNDCILDAYAALSADVKKKTGNKLYVSSSVRSAEEQEALYAEDPLTATLPGASEHQSGLALDVYVAYYAGDGFLKSPSGRFVNSHAHEYGFIIRYPSYGENITGIRFEPWHIRYVGAPHAQIIYKNSMTLEEYIASLKVGNIYLFDGYLISRQEVSDGKILIPNGCSEYTISPDNTGYYIVTGKLSS